MNLPRQYSKEVILKKIDTDTILNVFDQQKDGKIYQSMLNMALGSIESIDGNKPTINELKLFPLVDAEFLILESFKKFGLSTKLEGVYSCPRNGCGNTIIHEHSKDGYDTRIDIKDLDIIYSDNTDDLYKVEFEDFVIKKSEIEINIHSMSFRDITIGDLITISQKQGSIKNKLNEIFFKTLVDIEFISEPMLSLDNIKNRYRLELFNFPDYKYNEEIISNFRKFGIQLMQNFECDKCGKEWQTPIDFTSFFVYALTSLSKGMS